VLFTLHMVIYAHEESHNAVCAAVVGHVQRRQGG